MFKAITFAAYEAIRKAKQLRLPLKFHREDDPAKMTKEQWEQPKLHERASHLAEGGDLSTPWGSVHRGDDWDIPRNANVRWVKEMMNVDRLRPTEVGKNVSKVDALHGTIKNAHDAGHHWPPGMPFVKVSSRYESADGKVHHDVTDGHHRHLAAVKAGLKEIPVLRQLNPQEGPGSHRGWVEHRLKLGKEVHPDIMAQHPGLEKTKHDPEYAKKHEEHPYGVPMGKYTLPRGPTPLAGRAPYIGSRSGGGRSTRTLAGTAYRRFKEEGGEHDRPMEGGERWGEKHGWSGSLRVEHMPTPAPPSHYDTPQAPGGGSARGPRDNPSSWLSGSSSGDSW
tara:strand:+ start:396 stop:1403 length:1008 start_codon:yes stop_codon:yes gene_type:complete